MGNNLTSARRGSSDRDWLSLSTEILDNADKFVNSADVAPNSLYLNSESLTSEHLEPHIFEYVNDYSGCAESGSIQRIMDTAFYNTYANYISSESSFLKAVIALALSSLVAENDLFESQGKKPIKSIPVEYEYTQFTSNDLMLSSCLCMTAVTLRTNCSLDIGSEIMSTLTTMMIASEFQFRKEHKLRDELKKCTDNQLHTVCCEVSLFSHVGPEDVRQTALSKILEVCSDCRDKNLGLQKAFLTLQFVIGFVRRSSADVMSCIASMMLDRQNLLAVAAPIIKILCGRGGSEFNTNSLHHSRRSYDLLSLHSGESDSVKSGSISDSAGSILGVDMTDGGDANEDLTCRAQHGATVLLTALSQVCMINQFEMKDPSILKIISNLLEAMMARHLAPTADEASLPKSTTSAICGIISYLSRLLTLDSMTEMLCLQYQKFVAQLGKILQEIVMSYYHRHATVASAAVKCFVVNLDVFLLAVEDQYAFLLQMLAVTKESDHQLGMDMLAARLLQNLDKFKMHSFLKYCKTNNVCSALFEGIIALSDREFSRDSELASVRKYQKIIDILFTQMICCDVPNVAPDCQELLSIHSSIFLSTTTSIVMTMLNDCEEKSRNDIDLRQCACYATLPFGLRVLGVIISQSRLTLGIDEFVQIFQVIRTDELELKQTEFLQRIDFSLQYCKLAIVQRLLTWKGSDVFKETDTMWLSCPYLSAQLGDEAVCSGEVSTLLFQLTCGEQIGNPVSDAAKLISVLKRHVPLDRGGKSSLVVYAAAAALIWHYRMGEEACFLVNHKVNDIGVAPEPSREFIEIWSLAFRRLKPIVHGWLESEMSAQQFEVISKAKLLLSHVPVVEERTHSPGSNSPTAHKPLASSSSSTSSREASPRQQHVTDVTHLRRYSKTSGTPIISKSLGDSILDFLVHGPEASLLQHIESARHEIAKARCAGIELALKFDLSEPGVVFRMCMVIKRSFQRIGSNENVHFSANLTGTSKLIQDKVRERFESVMVEIFKNIACPTLRLDDKLIMIHGALCLLVQDFKSSDCEMLARLNFFEFLEQCINLPDRINTIACKLLELLAARCCVACTGGVEQSGLLQLVRLPSMTHAKSQAASILLPQLLSSMRCVLQKRAESNIWLLPGVTNATSDIELTTQPFYCSEYNSGLVISGVNLCKSHSFDGWFVISEYCHRRVIFSKCNPESKLSSASAQAWESFSLHWIIDKFVLQISDGTVTGYQVSTKQAVQKNSWTRFSYTLDLGTQTINLFINGILDHSESLSDGVCQVAYAASGLVDTVDDIEFIDSAYESSSLVNSHALVLGKSPIDLIHNGVPTLLVGPHARFCNSLATVVSAPGSFLAIDKSPLGDATAVGCFLRVMQILMTGEHGTRAILSIAKDAFAALAILGLRHPYQPVRYAALRAVGLIMPCVEFKYFDMAMNHLCDYQTSQAETLLAALRSLGSMVTPSSIRTRLQQSTAGITQAVELCVLLRHGVSSSASDWCSMFHQVTHAAFENIVSDYHVVIGIFAVCGAVDMGLHPGDHILYSTSSTMPEEYVMLGCDIMYKNERVHEIAQASSPTSSAGSSAGLDIIRVKVDQLSDDNLIVRPMPETLFNCMISNIEALSSCCAGLASVPEGASDRDSSFDAMEIASTHPCLKNSCDYWSIDFSGAMSIVIAFHPNCELDYGRGSYLRFLESRDSDVQYGRTCSGPLGNAEWPSEIIIPSDHCHVQFVSDAAESSWGFSFSAYPVMPSHYLPGVRMYNPDVCLARIVMSMALKALIATMNDSRMTKLSREEFDGALDIISKRLFSTSLQLDSISMGTHVFNRCHENVMRSLWKLACDGIIGCTEQSMPHTYAVDRTAPEGFSAAILENNKLSSLRTDTGPAGKWVDISDLSSPTIESGILALFHSSSQEASSMTPLESTPASFDDSSDRRFETSTKLQLKELHATTQKFGLMSLLNELLNISINTLCRKAMISLLNLWRESSEYLDEANLIVRVKLLRADTSLLNTEDETMFNTVKKYCAHQYELDQLKSSNRIVELLAELAHANFADITTWTQRNICNRATLSFEEKMTFPMFEHALVAVELLLTIPGDNGFLGYEATLGSKILPGLIALSKNLLFASGMIVKLGLKVLGLLLTQSQICFHALTRSTQQLLAELSKHLINAVEMIANCRAQTFHPTALYTVLTEQIIVAGFIVTENDMIVLKESEALHVPPQFPHVRPRFSAECSDSAFTLLEGNHSVRLEPGHTKDHNFVALTENSLSQISTDVESRRLFSCHLKIDRKSSGVISVGLGPQSSKYWQKCDNELTPTPAIVYRSDGQLCQKFANSKTWLSRPLGASFESNDIISVIGWAQHDSLRELVFCTNGVPQESILISADTPYLLSVLSIAVWLGCSNDQVSFVCDPVARNAVNKDTLQDTAPMSQLPLPLQSMSTALITLKSLVPIANDSKKLSELAIADVLIPMCQDRRSFELVVSSDEIRELNANGNQILATCTVNVPGAIGYSIEVEKCRVGNLSAAVYDAALNDCEEAINIDISQTSNCAVEDNNEDNSEFDIDENFKFTALVVAMQFRLAQFKCRFSIDLCPSDVKVGKEVLITSPLSREAVEILQLRHGGWSEQQMRGLMDTTAVVNRIDCHGSACLQSRGALLHWNPMLLKSKCKTNTHSGHQCSGNFGCSNRQPHCKVHAQHGKLFWSCCDQLVSKGAVYCSACESVSDSVIEESSHVRIRHVSMLEMMLLHSGLNLTNDGVMLSERFELMGHTGVIKSILPDKKTCVVQFLHKPSALMKWNVMMLEKLIPRPVKRENLAPKCWASDVCKIVSTPSKSWSCDVPNCPKREHPDGSEERWHCAGHDVNACFACCPGPSDPYCTRARNKAGMPVALGKAPGGQNNFYCGRNMGRELIPWSSGVCGPSNGPQCPDCRGLSAAAPPDNSTSLPEPQCARVVLEKGSLVTRGGLWRDQDDEDGGAGSVGVIVQCLPTSSLPDWLQQGCAVVVQWQRTQFIGSYYYDSEGPSELQVFHTPIELNIKKKPTIVRFSSIHFETRKVQQSDSICKDIFDSDSVSGTNKVLIIRIKPILSPEVVLASDEYAVDRNICNQLFLGSNVLDTLVLSTINSHFQANSELNAQFLQDCQWPMICPHDAVNNLADQFEGLLSASAAPMFAICRVKKMSLEEKEESKTEILQCEEKNDSDSDTDSIATSLAAFYIRECLYSACQSRFHAIKQLNLALRDRCDILETNWGDSDNNWISQLLSHGRVYILSIIKMSLLDLVIVKSLVHQPETSNNNRASRPLIKISRFTLESHINKGEIDLDGRWTTFGQAFRQLHGLPVAQFRKVDRVWEVKLQGENAIDNGGPYRESISGFAAELMTTALPLLCPCPNARVEIGDNREMWILNPDATTSDQLQMFAFFGKLIGICVRTKNYLELDLAVVCWKAIVGEPITLDDIKDIDLVEVKRLEELNAMDGRIDDGYFRDVDLCFQANSLSGAVVELHPGGSATTLTRSNKDQYCKELEKFLLTEFNRVASVIRSGLVTMIPPGVLRLLTGADLERLACGEKVINVDLLEAVAVYEGCLQSDAHVVMFWAVLRELTEGDRASFLKFVWGRTRLPLTREGFGSRAFKFQRYVRNTSFDTISTDQLLPIAHTCFFSIELPAYSCKEALRERLLFAIHNCPAIDGDGRGADAAVLLSP